MSYLTVEVEIDHGRVSSKGAEALPEKASGLLTILNPPPLSQPRKLKQDWAGGLADLATEYNSVQLQHKASEWRGA